MSRTFASTRFHRSVSGGSRSRVPRTAFSIVVRGQGLGFRDQWPAPMNAGYLTLSLWPLLPFFQILFLIADVVLAVLQDHLLVLVAEGFAEFSRHAHPQRARLNDRAFRDQGSGGDDRAGANARSIQDDHAHPDEAPVFYDATVKRDRVSDRHPIADNYRPLSEHAVQHAAILDVAVGADADHMHVAAYHGVHPDTGVFAQHDVANHLRRFVDVTGSRDRRADAFVGADHSSSKKPPAGGLSAAGPIAHG